MLNKKSSLLLEKEDPPPSSILLDTYQESSIYDDSFFDDDFVFDDLSEINQDLIPNIRVERIKDLIQCEKLWRAFSPNKSLFDTWEFRYAFYLGYQHKPYFILLKSGTEKVGLLPLWYEADKKKYFWFGSWWQEDNTFFVKNPIYIPMLLDLALPPLHLNAIEASVVENLGAIGANINFELDDPKYVVDLRYFDSLKNFMMSLKKKRRYNLRRDHKTIQQLNPQIIFDRYDDFDSLVEISKKRFQDKNESTDWEDSRRVETFRQIINLAKEKQVYQIRMITVKIKDQIAAVDLIAIYNQIYYPLKCAYNVKDFPGIGNYVNLFEIEDALSLGMKKIDFLEMSYGWKDKWFQGIPLYKLEKN